MICAPPPPASKLHHGDHWNLPGGGIKGDVDHEGGSDADKTRKRYLKRD